ncbi:MAG: cupredoxin domain-containing protein [Bacillota bacterium]
MRTIRFALATLLLGSLILAGCGPAKAPTNTPAGQTTETKKPLRPELTAPFESALIALKEMNAAGKEKDFVKAETAFRTFREHWEKIRTPLRDQDPKLEQHIEDGAVELDVEFKKPTEEIRVYELDEETVKLGRLLSQAAELLGVPIREELIQRDPTMELPYNTEKRVEVTLVDHKIEPKVIELEQHTKVTFVVTNRGHEVHEFVIGYYALEVEEVLPGQTKELTFVTIDAGEFETACYYPGHFEVGMYGTLKVKPAELKK